MSTPGVIIFSGGYGTGVSAAISRQAVGQWYVDKYQAAAHERGHRAVAVQMRKQGVPFEIAYLTLFDKPAPKTRTA